jgi:hypothetical protein
MCFSQMMGPWCVSTDDGTTMCFSQLMGPQCVCTDDGTTMCFSQMMGPQYVCADDGTTMCLRRWWDHNVFVQMIGLCRWWDYNVFSLGDLWCWFTEEFCWKLLYSRYHFALHNLGLCLLWSFVCWKENGPQFLSGLDEVSFIIQNSENVCDLSSWDVFFPVKFASKCE